jgi:hypothetical protein
LSSTEARSWRRGTEEVDGEDDGEVAVGGPKAPLLVELAAVGSIGDPVEEVAEEDGGEVAGGGPEAPQLGVGRQRGSFGTASKPNS